MCTSPLKPRLFRHRSSAQTAPSAQKLATESRQSQMWRKPRGQFVRRDSIALSREARGPACHGSLETCGAFLLFWLYLRSRGGFLAINIFIADVALCVRVNRCLIDPRQHALHFSRGAHDQAARWNRHALRDQRARRYDAARTNRHAVQNNRAHADEATRLDGAAMQRNRMADGHVIAKN